MLKRLERYRLISHASQAQPCVQRISVFFVLSLLVFSHGAFAQRAKVWVFVRSDYQSDSSVQSAKMLSTLIPPTRAFLKSSVSQLIFDHYGLSEKVDPETYDAVLRQVVNVNKIQDLNRTKPGPVLIPSLPRKDLTSPGRYNRYNDIPKMLIGSLGSIAGRIGRNPASSEQNFVTAFLGQDDTLRKAARGTVLSIEGDPSAITKMTDSLYSLRQKYIVLSKQITADFSSEAYASSASQLSKLSGQESAEITRDLGAARRRSFLLVLDSGWPSVDAMKSSVSALQAELDAAFALYKLPKKQWHDIAQFDNPIVDHCAKIDSALTPFLSLDSRRVVEVIYVPMSADQSARELLEAIVELHLARQYNNNVDNDNWEGYPAIQWPSKTLRMFEGTASEAVEGIPRPDKNTPQSMISDQVLIDAVWNLADIMSVMHGTRSFVNMSWTVPNQRITPPCFTHQSSMAVVAVGNDSDDFVSMERAFGYWITSRADILAVMNLSLAGEPVCHTCTRDLSTASHEKMAGELVGYDGSLGSGTCGTSFSSPRVAWVIAAGEALKATLEDSPHWIPTVVGQLEASLNTSAPGFGRYLFTPSTYLHHILVNSP